jgi:hypothetical protein
MLIECRKTTRDLIRLIAAVCVSYSPGPDRETVWQRVVVSCLESDSITGSYEW